MTIIDQSELKGKIRDQPIDETLRSLLSKAGSASGIDTIFVVSGGQPGSTGRTTGSTRHNNGQAADLYVVVGDKKQAFSDKKAPEVIQKFITACAAYGANGIGAGVGYMGPNTLHVGFGIDESDRRKIVWGANGRAKNAPEWLREAANSGWYSPPGWVYDLEDDEVEDLPENADVILGRPASTLVDIPARFNEEVILAAQESQREWGIPTSVTLAQWAIESAYGTRMPPGSNNPFGIKARAGEASVQVWTTEFVGGRLRKVLAEFRSFPSLEAAFSRHARLLGKGSPYADARKFLDDPDKFADALTGVYATDPQYGTKLKSIMKSNNLYAFNVEREASSINTKASLEKVMSNYLFEGHQDKMAVEGLQRKLTSLGYKLGKIDGLFGPLTTEALLAFQNENGIPTTGVVDDVTQSALNSAQPRRFGKEREAMTEKELALAGSRTMINARRGRFLSWVLGAFGVLGVGNSTIVNSAPETASTSSPVLDSLPADFATQYPGLAALIESLSSSSNVTQPQMRTVFDLLPQFFANDTVLQTAMQGVATVGASLLPGFGGSVGVLAAGLLGRLFANKVADARLGDHRSGGNLNPLE